MESTSSSRAAVRDALASLFDDLVRLEIHVWNRVDDRLRRDHELPLSWFEPMQVMDRTPGCRVADIARVLSITVGGTSKLVDRIEQAGWCIRTPNPDDARSSLVHLTPVGRRLLHRARVTFHAELERARGSAIPPERLASFVATVRGARRRLEDEPASAR